MTDGFPKLKRVYIAGLVDFLAKQIRKPKPKKKGVRVIKRYEESGE